MDGWNSSFLLGRPIFRGYASFRECTCYTHIFCSGTMGSWWMFHLLQPSSKRWIPDDDTISMMKIQQLIMALFWIYPPTNNRHHKDNYSTFLVGNHYKPLFSTVTGKKNNPSSICFSLPKAQESSLKMKIMPNAAPCPKKNSTLGTCRILYKWIQVLIVLTVSVFNLL